MKTQKRILFTVLVSLMATILLLPIPTYAAKKISINKTKDTLIVGETVKLKITDTKKQVIWFSSNEGVATVDVNGKVLALSKGNTKITAIINNKKYTCKIKVEAPQINKTGITLFTGESIQLKMKGTTEKIKWSTKNSKIATVNSKGKVIAKKSGKTIITAKIGSKKYTCNIQVIKIDSDSSKVKKKVKQVISQNIKPSMSQAEKAKVIHDWIVLNCNYDYENYKKGTIPRLSYTAEGVLLKKKAVCQGYSEAYKLFMDALNIPCDIVSSWEMNHAWNNIKLDGKWYHVDVTWDDPVYARADGKTYSFSDRTSYKYFLLTDKELAKDHQWVTNRKCNGDVNKYISIFGKILYTIPEIQNYFTPNTKKEGYIVIPNSLVSDDFKLIGYIAEGVQGTGPINSITVDMRRVEKGDYFVVYFKWKYVN